MDPNKLTISKLNSLLNDIVIKHTPIAVYKTFRRLSISDNGGLYVGIWIVIPPMHMFSLQVEIMLTSSLLGFPN